MIEAWDIIGDLAHEVPEAGEAVLRWNEARPRDHGGKSSRRTDVMPDHLDTQSFRAAEAAARTVGPSTSEA